MCSDCPVTCVSEANLQKHMEREHSNKDPDDGFVLHEGEFFSVSGLKNNLGNCTEELFWCSDLTSFFEIGTLNIEPYHSNKDLWSLFSLESTNSNTSRSCSRRMLPGSPHCTTVPQSRFCRIAQGRLQILLIWAFFRKFAVAGSRLVPVGSLAALSLMEHRQH